MLEFGKIIAFLAGLLFIVLFLAFVMALVQDVWRSLVKMLSPDDAPAPPGTRHASVIAPRAPSRTEAEVRTGALPFPEPSPLPDETVDLEMRVSLGADHGIGRRLTIEVRGGPVPSRGEYFVYVVTGFSSEQGKEFPLRFPPTDSMATQPFSSVHTRTLPPRHREEWSVLTSIDLEAMYPARSGRQNYVFTCRVHRPGADIGVGLPGPHGRALDSATATHSFALADFGYLEMHEWLKVREDAVTFLVRVVHQCEVGLGTKWAHLSDWVLALRPASAPQVVQDYVKKNLANYYRALRAAPSTSSNRSIALGKDASPDFQRELVALARGLVNEEPADSPARKTYESLRGTCWEALSTWVERDKEPLPPRPVSQPAKPTPSAPPPPPPAPAWAPLPPPWEPDPVPVPLGGGDQEKVEQMRAVLTIARVAAVLGFSNTTHAQDKILDKFKRRLIDNIHDDATRARVEADLQAYLDEATAVIGLLSYFKRRLDAAVAPVGFYIRDLLGETMRELIQARSDCSADGYALYGHGVRKYAWAPLSVPRPKRFPPPAPKPRPAPPPKPAPVRPANPTPRTTPSPLGPPESLSLAELKARVGMPGGLDREGQVAFIRQKFDRWNSQSLTTRDSGERVAIAQRLRYLAQLRRLLG